MSGVSQSIDYEQLAEVVANRIMSAKRAQWVDPETHSEHHDWIKQKVAEEEDLRLLRRRIIASACIWAVPLIMAFLASAFWRELIRLIKGG